MTIMEIKIKNTNYWRIRSNIILRDNYRNLSSCVRDCSTCVTVPTAGRNEPRKTAKCEKPSPPVFAMKKMGKGLKS